MKILVTGCAGFIGWNVCRQAILEGHDVVGLDNINDAYDVRLKRWRLSQETFGQPLIFRQGDITDKRMVSSLFDQGSFDAVINLAGRAGVRDSLTDPWIYYETNLIGTVNLLECCREFRVKKFILSSTSSVYGDGPRPYQEDGPTDTPLSPYAASKKAAELTCYTYHKQYALDVSVLRYFTVYGPAGRPDMSVFRFIRQIAEGHPLTLYGDGSQQRDFTYVGDIATGTIAALKELGFEIINLGSDRPISILHLISSIEEMVGRTANVSFSERHPADVFATWADISKAGSILSWTPKTSFEKGIADSVSWYRDQQSWAKTVV